MKLHFVDYLVALLCVGVVVLASTWPVQAATPPMWSVTTPPTQPSTLESPEHLQ